MIHVLESDNKQSPKVKQRLMLAFKKSKKCKLESRTIQGTVKVILEIVENVKHLINFTSCSK
jgi:hypothetical protein